MSIPILKIIDLVDMHAGVYNPQPMTHNDDFNFDASLQIEAARIAIREVTGRPISASQVRRLCAAGKLVAKKIGRDWFIDSHSISRLNRGRTGPKRKF